jgi:hypothetical protein
VAQSEIVHAFLEGTTCRDLVREFGRSPLVDSNELFGIATSFASGEKAVGAIFDGKKGKRMDDAPAEGSKSKEPHQKSKRGKKGKKSRCEAREQGHDDGGDEALAVDPARRGPRPAPRGPGVFDDMLKKPCPYHKTPVNHTLEQCDMLKRFYGRAAAKDGEAMRKLLEAGFIKEVFHPTSLANPVLVKKKNGKWQMCVDYTSLNKACPKVPIPLPRIDQIVDSTAGCELLCFLDAYSGYHQIKMKESDQLATSFITPFGMYCYVTMPFGL